jgi:hypothetical protein
MIWGLSLTNWMFIGGAVLIVTGCVYLWKPGLYRRGLWMKTSIAIRLLSEQNYARYIKGLGVAYICIGVALLVAAILRQISN